MKTLTDRDIPIVTQRTPEEIARAREEITANYALARDEARKRGYKRNPRIAAENIR